MSLISIVLDYQKVPSLKMSKQAQRRAEARRKRKKVMAMRLIITGTGAGVLVGWVVLARLVL